MPRVPAASCASSCCACCECLRSLVVLQVPTPLRLHTLRYSGASATTPRTMRKEARLAARLPSSVA